MSAQATTAAVAPISDTLSTVADAFSIAGSVAALAATALAFYIFVGKRKELRAFLRAVSNFALQDSLRELRTKLDDLDKTDASIEQEVVNVKFHKICGQLEGNPILAARFSLQVVEIRKATRSKKPLTERRKAELVHKMRESLKYINAEVSAGDTVRSEE